MVVMKQNASARHRVKNLPYPYLLRWVLHCLNKLK